MKTLKVFVLPLFLVAFSSLQSFANSPTSKTSELRKEIMELVDNIDLTEMDTESEKVTIQFVVNVKREIVILDIEDSPISSQIVDLLDRKGVAADGVEVNKVFVLPMVFNKK